MQIGGVCDNYLVYLWFSRLFNVYI